MGLFLVYLIAATWQDNPGAVRLFWLKFCDAAWTSRRRSGAEDSRSSTAASWSGANLVFFHIRLHRSVPATSTVVLCPGAFSTRGRNRLSQPAI